MFHIWELGCLPKQRITSTRRHYTRKWTGFFQGKYSEFTLGNNNNLIRTSGWRNHSPGCWNKQSHKSKLRRWFCKRGLRTFITWWTAEVPFKMKNFLNLLSKKAKSNFNGNSIRMKRYNGGEYWCKIHGSKTIISDILLPKNPANMRGRSILGYFGGEMYERWNIYSMYFK